MTGLDLEPGHPQDREARLYFEDEFHDEGEAIDVHGGWYDAGDYGKYVPPAAVTLAQMLLAYELNPDTFEVGQFATPGGASEDEREAGLPDLLAEAKFELGWFERMQRPDGAFAMAARVFRAFDAAFADRMLETARSAFAYLREHPTPRFRSDEGQNDGSGAYRKDGDGAERFWAAAELLKTTGEPSYADYVDSEVATQVSLGARHVAWGNANLLGKWAYYTAGGGSDEYTETIAETLTGTADEVAGDADYRRAARDQLHYVLGRSPTNRGYVTGAGERAARNPHSRLAASTGTNVLGNVVGGPSHNGGDPELDAYLSNQNPAPVKAYLDVQGSWASNEPALDYAAPFVPLAATFTPADAVGVE